MKKAFTLLIILFSFTVKGQDTLNLKLFSEGYYLGNGLQRHVLYNEGVNNTADSLTRTDTIIVELHNAISPYAVVDSVKAHWMTDGRSSAIFSSAIAGHSYYIVIRHRNMILTWSAAPYYFAATGNNYDFTTDSTKAQGNNMAQVDSGVWAFHSGDINQDQNIDLIDFTYLNYACHHFLCGYYSWFRPPHISLMTAI